MNKLKFLRNELNMTVRDFAEQVDFAPSTLTQYENETRDPGTTAIRNFASFFHVTIDYLLCHNDLGLYVYYENSDDKFVLTEKDYLKYKHDGLIYYIDNKRFIDLNQKLNIPKEKDLSEILLLLSKNDTLTNYLMQDTVKIDVPVDKMDSIKKIIQLDDEKFVFIEQMLKML